MLVIALGTNLGDRAAYLREAVRQLTDGDRPIITAPRCSGVYENPALLPDGSPPEWDRPFYNMAIGGETLLTPEPLLAELKAIEQRMGRHRREFWGPREIDIDIMVLDDQVIETDALTIPHAGLLKRAFFLLPLADIAPGWTYPMAGMYEGKTARELALTCDSSMMTNIATHPKECVDEQC